MHIFYTKVRKLDWVKESFIIITNNTFR